VIFLVIFEEKPVAAVQVAYRG